jgi:hypothetical protein
LFDVELLCLKWKQPLLGSTDASLLLVTMASHYLPSFFFLLLSSVHWHTFISLRPLHVSSHEIVTSV